VFHFFSLFKTFPSFFFFFFRASSPRCLKASLDFEVDLDSFEAFEGLMEGPTGTGDGVLRPNKVGRIFLSGAMVVTFSTKPRQSITHGACFSSQPYACFDWESGLSVKRDYSD
jgi:hypothetical protein